VFYPVFSLASFPSRRNRNKVNWCNTTSVLDRFLQVHSTTSIRYSIDVLVHPFPCTSHYDQRLVWVRIVLVVWSDCSCSQRNTTVFNIVSHRLRSKFWAGFSTRGRCSAKNTTGFNCIQDNDNTVCFARVRACTVTFAEQRRQRCLLDDVDHHHCGLFSPLNAIRRL